VPILGFAVLLDELIAPSVKSSFCWLSIDVVLSLWGVVWREFSADASRPGALYGHLFTIPFPKEAFWVKD